MSEQQVRRVQQVFDLLSEQVARDGLDAADTNVYVELGYGALEDSERAQVLSTMATLAGGLGAVPTREAEERFPEACGYAARFTEAARTLYISAGGIPSEVTVAANVKEDADAMIAVMRELLGEEEEVQRRTAVVLMAMMGSAWQAANAVEEAMGDDGRRG